MIYAYEDYKKQPGSLAAEEMAALHREMAAEDDPDEDGPACRLCKICRLPFQLAAARPGGAEK